MGIPSVTVTMPGFPTMARAVANSAGYPDLRIVLYPGPGSIILHGDEVIRQRIEDVLCDQVIQALTGPIQKSNLKTAKSAEVLKDRDIAFSGTFDEVNEYFYNQTWGDGLPIVPPTIEKIEEFLKYTDRRPEEIIGVLQPGLAKASVWKVAVNGVMAGCRPEYMPILVGIVEVMADPKYGLVHSGSTPGWEPIIILNGPIRDQLGFNSQTAVMRPGNQANTSVGRFYRLFARNVARLLPGSTDMATFGQMFRAVVPENEQAVREVGWRTLSQQRGFASEDNVVTIASARAISDPLQTSGDDPTHHLDYIVNWASRMIEPYQAANEYVDTHILLMTPLIAQFLSNAGYRSKEDVVKYLRDHMMVSAKTFEQGVNWFKNEPYNLIEAAKQGKIPQAWAESDDPNRMVPLLLPESQILVVVTGLPTRSRSTFIRQNFTQGYATSKRILLPKAWDSLIRNKNSALEAGA